jgi:hypothetical protein
VTDWHVTAAPPPAPPAAPRRWRLQTKAAVAALLVVALVATTLVWWRWREGQRVLTEDQFDRLAHAVLIEAMGVSQQGSPEATVGLVYYYPLACGDVLPTTGYPMWRWTRPTPADPSSSADLTADLSSYELILYPGQGEATAAVEAWLACVRASDAVWPGVTDAAPAVDRRDGVTTYVAVVPGDAVLVGGWCEAVSRHLAVYRNVLVVGPRVSIAGSCAQPAAAGWTAELAAGWTEFATGAFKAAVDQVVEAT